MFDIRILKQVRKRLGLTQHQFAKEAGVSQSLIAKIEAGSIDPSYSHVMRIEEAIQRLISKKEVEAKDIMTKKVICVQVTASAKKVINLMKEKNISQLPVLDYNQVVGLISENTILAKDITKIKMLKAREIMTDSPPIVAEYTRLSAIAALLKQFPLVLVRKNARFVGVITKSDLIRALI